MGEDQLDHQELGLDGPITSLGWKRLGLHSSEMMNVIKDCEVWRLGARAAAPATLTEKRAMKKEEVG